MALSEKQWNKSSDFLSRVEETWLIMELFTMVAYILSNVTYLTVRFCKKEGISLKEPSLKSHTKSDFVDANYANMNLCGAIMAPFFISAN
jgi:hypothetical protein